MVYRILLIFSLPILILSAFGCTPPEPEQESIPVPKEIAAANEGIEDTSAYPASSPPETNEIGIGPLTELDPKIVSFSIINHNLDLDQNEEQIILGRTKDDPDGAIRVFIIDFDTVSNEYILSWDGETQASNIRTFNISFLDVIGDHKLEIICSGINKDGLRCLDIFRQTFSPSGIGLFFTSICSISADGSIDIREHERSQAYKQGQRNGRSFPIITFSQNKDTDNIMDLIREEYYWKYQENTYVKGKTEFIPGKKIEEEQLRELFTKDTEAFEDFLSGTWLITNHENVEDMTAIYFSPLQSQIVFFSKGIQEIYEWENSHRTRIPNSIYISVTNEMVPFIKKYVSIYVESLDVIRVEINDRDFTKSNFMWDGTFTRLVESAEYGILADATYLPSPGLIQAHELHGVYENSSGETISFDYPYIDVETRADSYRGKYSLYSFEDKNILDIKIVSPSNTLLGSKNFIIEYAVDETERIIIHKLSLTAVEIGVFGFTYKADTAVTYLQYEEKEPAASFKE